MRGLGRDLYFAARSLLRQPGFTLVAILSLVLGIGTNTAIFTLLDAVFLRPLPLDEIGRLTVVFQSLRSRSGDYTGERGLSYANFHDILERQRSFEGLALYQPASMNFSGGSEPLRATGLFATANYFEVLGLEPAVGRFFVPTADGSPLREPAVVLSHGAWTRLFGAAPDIVDRPVRVNGESMIVIGVAPRGFKGTELAFNIDFFVPVGFYERLSPYGAFFERRTVGLFPAIGRLRDGVTVEQASAEMMALSRQLEADHPKDNEGLGGLAMPLSRGALGTRQRDDYVGYARTLGVAVALILLIACLNVANLLVVRGVERGREIAVRQALGAGRGRLLRQLMTENLLLFVLGGLLSLPVAAMSLELFAAFRPPNIPEGAIARELDAVVWVFALAVAAVVGLVFGILPALAASRSDLVANLKETAPLAAGRSLPPWLRPRSLLVMTQVALALVALVGAGFFLRQLEAALALDLGFDTDRLAVLSVAPGEQGYEEAAARDFYRRMEQRAASLPGVTAVGLSQHRLLRGSVFFRQIFVPGQDEAIESSGGAFHRVNIVAPGFFDAVGISIDPRRDFTDNEPEGLQVAIVNEAMARRAWPGQDPIGERFSFDFAGQQPEVEVVGVASNARYRAVRESGIFFIYVPLAQSYASAMTLHVRTDGDPSALVPQLRREIQALDPALPLSDIGTMRHFVDEALWIERVSAMLLSIFGALAAVLAVVGIYGLLAYSVSRRGREFAVCIALGARRGHVVCSVLAEASGVILVGIVVGLVLVVWLLNLPVVSGQLYSVSVAEPGPYAVWALVLFVTALLGGLVPAWRAARTDPMRALRDE